MTEEQIQMLIKNLRLELDNEFNNKLHNHELKIRDMFDNFQKEVKATLDLKFEMQKHEIAELIENHRAVCDKIFVKLNGVSKFIKEDDLPGKTEQINKKLIDAAIEKYNLRTNFIISIIKLVSWIVLAISAITFVLVKLNILKVL